MTNAREEVVLVAGLRGARYTVRDIYKRAGFHCCWLRDTRCAVNNICKRGSYLICYHATRASRMKHDHFALACKGLTLEGFVTFMDCCLRTRDSNVVDYRGVISQMSGKAELRASQWLHV